MTAYGITARRARRLVTLVAVAGMLVGGATFWLATAGASDTLKGQSLQLTLAPGPLAATGDGNFALPLTCRGGVGDCSIQITITAAEPGHHHPRGFIVAEHSLAPTTNDSRVPLALTDRGLRALVSSPRFRLVVLTTARASDTGGHPALGATRAVFMGLPATGCWPRHSHTVARMGGGRAYTLAATGNNPVIRPTYGCLFAHGQGYALDHPYATQLSCLNGCPAISAPYVGYGVHGPAPYCMGAPGCPPAATTIRVMNLRTGRVVRHSPSAPAPEAAMFGGAPTSIMVTGSAVPAWIVESYPDNYVNVLDAHGWHEIAAGPLIDPGFVQVVGTTVSWRENGSVHSQTLTP